jgi:DNA transformation protein and related proteins
MANSVAFQRIERDLLRLCASIPSGCVCTYADLGAVIDVPARHVAYIISRLDEATRAKYPVHRLLGTGGKLPAQAPRVAMQLAHEGLRVHKGVVVDVANRWFVPNADTATIERSTRPPEHSRSTDRQGKVTAALSELRGLGPVSVQMLVSVRITKTAQLHKADLFKLYAQIKAKHPRASINLLYAMMGAVDNLDWREVAKERRTEVLMRLEDMGLI